MTPPRPRTLRGRLLLIVTGAILLVLVLGVAAFNVVLRQSLDDDARNAARERAQSAAVALEDRLSTSGASPLVAVSGAETWVRYGTSTRIPAGVTLASDHVAQELLDEGDGTRDVAGQQMMLGTAPLMFEGARVGTVVAAVSLVPYARTEQHALIASAAFAGFIVLLVVAITAWALRSALRPIDTMARTAASWTEEGAATRFNQGAPVDEVGNLAHTLDQMLDRVQASLRHERRLTAEMSHELRTPLARIIGEADLALQRPRDDAAYRVALAGIRDSALRLDATVEALLAAARAEADGAVCDAMAVSREAAAAAQPADGTPAITVWGSDDVVRTGVDAAVLARILAPLLENAVRHARREARINVKRTTGEVLVTVHDDGPGIATDERDRVFEPGVRGRDAVGEGSGLGLALARRLARTAGGDVRVEAGDGGRLEVRLPTA